MIWKLIKELFMSLNYVDKGSSSRLDPSPNAPDLNQGRLAHNTTSISPRAEGTQAAGKVVTKDSVIVVNDGTHDVAKLGQVDSSTFGLETSDGTNIRAFAGSHTTLGQGFYVSKTGYDANTATGNNLIFNSNKLTLQVIDVLQATIASNTIGAGNVTNSATVDLTSYGLSATPLIFAFYTTGVAAVSLGSSPWGGTVVEFIGGTGTLNAFSILSTSHTSTSAVFNRKFINNSAGSLTVPQYNIEFMICTYNA